MLYLQRTLLAILALTTTTTTAQLNQLAKKAGLLYIGTAVDNGNLLNKTYKSIVTDTQEFGQLTPENGMKWFAVEPSPGVFNYTLGNEIANLATQDRQLLRCHALVWHSQLPAWVDQTTSWTAATLTAALKRHIFNEAQHWTRECYAWDVLNEALNEDGTYRNSTFLQVLGPAYIPLVFKFASQAAPRAKLYYNDYNIESPGPKATAAQAIVKSLKKQHIRIDGVGLQSHFIAGNAPSYAQQIQNMRAFESLGVDVAITELDVRLLLPTDATNLQQQSQAYVDAVQACVDVRACVGVTVWNFWDPVSWVPGVFTGYGAALLYFEDFTKHPAYYAIVDALKKSAKGKWKRIS
ncbi:glycosyl hydrolase family 10 protein [Phlyctema vagabunda]|uniref:Beta-xylanase n=1 Tax=Phlyctema vagabunda TaxID=108571 RepID=A0ABR4PCY2_9HELO